MPNATQTLITNSGIAAGAAVAWNGGPGVLYAEGTFTGATVNLQVQSPNGTWINVATITTAGVTNFDLPYGDQIRLNIAGGTPSGIYAYVKPHSDRRG